MPVTQGRNWRAQQNPTSFPTRQLFVLALCRICEPIAFMSIFPYVYYMVSSFHITSDDKQIAFYAGMVTSAFTFAEFSTSIPWGRLSDKIGRKPVLLAGMAGTGLSMIVFGLSPNLPTALIARALGGFLNGNMGVLQTTVGEVVTVEAHQSRAYTVMPFVWSLGSIIGSGLGGTLADPIRNYPGYFEPGTIFERYPYLLPNIVCAGVVVFGMIIGILFMEETHEDKKHRRDIGLEAGDWILSFFTSEQTLEKRGFGEESLTLLVDAPPGYSSVESSPALNPISVGDLPVQIQTPVHQTLGTDRRTSATIKAFTPQVILNIVSYGALAYHTISAEQLLPVLFSMPESREPPHLPFKFSGGFSLPTKDIGFILSVQGFIMMFATVFAYPVVTKRFGILATFRFAMLSYPLLYLMVPYLTLVPEALRMPGIYAVLVWKVNAQAFSFTSLSIMLANAAPSNRSLGTVNGAAASSASLFRALGPTISGLIQSAGLSLGVLGLPWWANSLVAVSGAVISLFMVEEKRRYSKADEANIEADGHEPFLDADVIEAPPTIAAEHAPDDNSLTLSR